ncbi:MAG: glycoside hydrolase family 31 protein [Opitutales bacterium]
MRACLSLLCGFGLLTSAVALDWSGLRPAGDVTGVVRRERGVELACADGTAVRLTVLAPDLVRVRTLFAGQPAAPDHSWAVARTAWDSVSWQVREEAAAVTLTTPEIEVVVHRHPLLLEFRDAATHRVINTDERAMARDPQTGRVAAAKRLGLDEHFYGLGEKAARLDRRRGEFVMWNSDTPGYTEGTDPIYQSIPFYLGWEDGRAYGLFYDNSNRSTFDLGHSGQDYAGYSADGGVLDYYFFYGPGLKKILGRYTELTGRMPLPPLWALGNQQCRYSYYPDSMVAEIARQYRARDLPLDVLYLDIHYMNGFRVFTWNPERFPDPAALTAALDRQGIKVVTIIDPGVKYQPPAAGAPAPGAEPDRGPQDQSYYVFNEGMAHDYFLHRQDGSLYIGEVWPGKAVFVDFTREDARRWWGGLFHSLMDRGVAGIWTDMNEPADFADRTGAIYKDVVFDDLGAKTLYPQNRNVFALNMARATYEGLRALRPDRRPFVITRAGYAGVQRYSTMWTGDNNATFPSLALNIPMFASLGLSGEAFVGSDLPGFIGRGDGELLARSYELAFLVPLCRNHAAVDDYDHEPWRYGTAYEDIVRRYLKLRYRLLPFLYTTLEEAHRTGVPWFRPLLLNFQDDPNTLNLDDEFMVGDALLAAPVLHAGERARDVYLPRGRWFDFWTGASVAGGNLFRTEAPLDHLPLYVRGGSIVPSTEPMNYTGEKPWDPLRFDIYPDDFGTAAGSLYEDDGATPAYEKGACRRTEAAYVRSAGVARLTVTPTGPYRPAPRQLEFAVHETPAPNRVSLDGQDLPRLRAGDPGPGHWVDPAGALHLRFADDARSHLLEFR